MGYSIIEVIELAMRLLRHQESLIILITAGIGSGTSPKTNMSNKLTIRNCKFAYRCSAKWDDLQETDDDDIRFCNDCQKEVFFCDSDDTLVTFVKLNRCVAILKSKSNERLLGDVLMQN